MAAELFIFLLVLIILAAGLVISLFVPDHWFDWVQKHVFGLEDFDD